MTTLQVGSWLATSYSKTPPPSLRSSSPSSTACSASGPRACLSWSALCQRASRPLALCYTVQTSLDLLLCTSWERYTDYLTPFVDALARSLSLGLACQAPFWSQRQLEFKLKRCLGVPTNPSQSSFPQKSLASTCATPSSTFTSSAAVSRCSPPCCHLGGCCLSHSLLWSPTPFLLAGDRQLLLVSSALDCLPLPLGAGPHPLLPALSVHKRDDGHHPPARHPLPEQRVLSCRSLAGCRSTAS